MNHICIQCNKSITKWDVRSFRLNKCCYSCFSQECPHCEKQHKNFKSINCWDCQKTHCSECDVKISKKFNQCFQCYSMQDSKKCPQCGIEFRGKYKLCFNCFKSTHI